MFLIKKYIKLQVAGYLLFTPIPPIKAEAYGWDFLFYIFNSIKLLPRYPMSLVFVHFTIMIFFFSTEYC